MKYNMEVLTVESGGEEQQILYVDLSEVIRQVRKLQDGDDIVIHAVDR